MLEPEAEIPDDRCGFVLQPEMVGFDSEEKEAGQWAHSVELTTCVRETWSNDRCIWHTDQEDKPVEELLSRRKEESKSFDGAILNRTSWPKNIAFENCSLIGSQWRDSQAEEISFNDSTLNWSVFTGSKMNYANFYDANSLGVDFSECELKRVKFSGSDIRNSNFKEAFLWDSRFLQTDLRGSEFIRANLTLAKMSHSKLRRTYFSDSDLFKAEINDADFTGSRFSGADLRGAELVDSHLQRVSFENADLQDAQLVDSYLQRANFSGSDLFRANLDRTHARYTKFDGATLEQAELVDSDLQNAVFTDSNCQKAEFQGAILHDTVLAGADCRSANFTDSLLYETVFSDTRINSLTTFYAPDNSYYDSITSRPAQVYEESPMTSFDLEDDTHRLEAARWVYRRLETLHEENAMSEEAREFHISKEEAERKLYKKRGEWKGRLVKGAMRWATRHGESLRQTITTWLAVILFFGVLYPFAGGIKDSERNLYRITSLSELATFDGLNDLLLNIYFSGITFSTIGYGDLSPAAPGTRTLVFVESLVGAVLVALLVFVLGRRVAR